MGPGMSKIINEAMASLVGEGLTSQSRELLHVTKLQCGRWCLVTRLLIITARLPWPRRHSKRR